MQVCLYNNCRYSSFFYHVTLDDIHTVTRYFSILRWALCIPLLLLCLERAGFLPCLFFKPSEPAMKKRFGPTSIIVIIPLGMMTTILICMVTWTVFVDAAFITETVGSRLDRTFELAVWEIVQLVSPYGYPCSNTLPSLFAALCDVPPSRLPVWCRAKPTSIYP